MSDWENDKQEFIEKLSSADKTFDEIFNIDNENLVIQGESRDKLQNLRESNKKILHKLQSREFSVAVVGLEKAGKSTLGNALIKRTVLPEYSSRCTYTTTEIRSGDTDVAEVYFYSREEFNKNFKRLLNELNYPESVDFSSMTLETFKRYWQAMEIDQPQFFLLHNGTTAEDIKTMLEGKQKILSLLGGVPENYDLKKLEECKDKFNLLVQRITGMAGLNPDGTVIRVPDPYAVKNVIIRSTQLADMSHLVLYDVPGFDSPTELHKRQTEEMLKESDAIILVTNVGDRPDLTGPQLDMLRKGQDRDGIKLSAKCFVFGNKIDRASDLECAKHNSATLRNAVVNRYQIALGNHIVVGSARAYLETEGLMSGNVASKIIDEWQLPDSYGIKILQDKMQDYYDNDRFEVLKQRAEKILSDTRETLQNLQERYNTGEFKRDDTETEIVQEIQSKLSKFVEDSNRITKQHTDQILAEKPFTNALKADINKVYPLVNDENGHTELIKKIELELGINPDDVYPTTKVNSNLRERLFKSFVEGIVTSASKLTVERQKILRQALVEKFLEVMEMEQSTVYKAELEESVNKLFDEMLIDGGAQCKFNSLVERFVTALIRALIDQPFAEDERRDQVKATLAELVALSVYYNMPNKSEQNTLQIDDIGRGGSKFFAKILAHEGVESSVDDDAESPENENFLRDLFMKHKDQVLRGASFALDLLPLGKWAKILMKVGINLNEMRSDGGTKARDKLDYKIEALLYDPKWVDLPADKRVSAIDNLISAYKPVVNASASGDETHTFIDELDKLHESAKKIKRMQTKDEMIATLDTDIEILRDITDKSVIKAIGLEVAFVSIVVKNVELIRTHLRDKKGGKSFRDWCRMNAEKLMPTKFGLILENKANNTKREAILNRINECLNKM